jgi:ribonucleoside-diphosphate reductase alpha chain
MCDEELFLAAERESDEYELRWPIHGETLIRKSVSARALLNAIAENAAHHGCPGVLFERALKRNCPSHGYSHHHILTTNPCGEQGLPAFDSCRLGVLNLTKFVLNPFQPDACFDFTALKRAAWIGTQLLDDVVDWELDCQRNILQKIERDDSIPFEERITNQRMWLRAIAMAERGRRVGLSATGLGDCIAMLGMRYGDEASLEFAESIAKSIQLSALECSIWMAEKRGAFLDFDPEIDCENEHVKHLIPLLPESAQRRYQQFGRRNIACTTWSPAGTISELIGCSSGCEPLPWIRYDRRVKSSSVSPENLRGDYAIETDSNGTEWCTFRGTISQSIARWMIGSGCADPMDSSNPYRGQTCTEIPVEAKLQMLTRLQRWCDSSISNTTNLLRGSTAGDVLACIKRAHELNLKGCTAYVDGSRDGVVLEAGSATKTHQIIANAISYLRKRSDSISSDESRLARELSEILPSGTRVEIACECGCKSMLKTGGCWQCPECGESKCG